MPIVKNKPAKKYFGTPPDTPFVLPGDYVTKGGTISVGGGSSYHEPQPTKPTTTTSPAVQETQEQSALAEEIRARAEQEGVSPEVMAVRMRAGASQQARDIAEERGVDISTPARQKGFIRTLRKEQEIRGKEKETKIKTIQKKEEKQPRTYTIKDVSFKESFFPTVGTRAERGLTLTKTGEGVEGGKILLQTYQEIKLGQASDYVSDKIWKVVPKKVKEFNVPFTDKKVEDIRNVRVRTTDIEKFALFAPFMVTTPGVLKTSIQSGQIKPVVETKFVADVVKKGQVSDIKLLSQSEVGGIKTFQASRQTVKTEKSVSIGEGKSLTQRSLGGGKREFTAEGFVGGSQELGVARQVKGIRKGVSGEVEIGTGVRGGSLSTEIGGVIQRRGIRAGVPELTGVKSRTISFKGKTARVDLQKEEVIGVIRKVGVTKQGQTISRFAGTTDDVGRVLTKGGFKSRIPTSDINVRGLIRSKTIPKEGIGKFIQTGSPKTPLSKTFKQSLTKNVQSSVTGSIAKTTRTAKETLIKDVGSIKTSRGFVRASGLKTTTKESYIPQGRIQMDLSGSRIGGLETGRIPTLGVSKSRLDLIVRGNIRTGTKGKTKLKGRGVEREREDLIIREGLKTKFKQPQKTNERYRISQKQKQKQQRVPTSITTRTPTTRTPIGGFPKLFFGKSKEIKSSKGTFGVSIRRYGKFKTIGTGLSLGKAISLGTGRVGGTLGATFKIFPTKQGKVTGGIRIPKGFYTKTSKKGLLFIEQPKYRLSTTGEIGEIQIAKRRRKR